jgi:hypothetical protein
VWVTPCLEVRKITRMDHDCCTCYRFTYLSNFDIPLLLLVNVQQLEQELVKYYKELDKESDTCLVEVSLQCLDMHSRSIFFVFRGY